MGKEQAKGQSQQDRQQEKQFFHEFSSVRVNGRKLLAAIISRKANIHSTNLVHAGSVAEYCCARMGENQVKNRAYPYGAL